MWWEIIFLTVVTKEMMWVDDLKMSECFEQVISRTQKLSCETSFQLQNP